MIYDVLKWGRSRGIVGPKSGEGEEGDGATPGYTKMEMQCGIFIHSDGRLVVNLIGNREFKVPFLTPNEIKASRPKVPKKPGGFTGSPGRHFLWDNIEIITDGPKAKRWAHGAFLDMLDRAAAGGVKDAATIATTLRERLPEIRELVSKAGIKSNARASFSIDDQWIIEKDDWKTWWDSERARINALMSRGEAPRMMVSIASGAVVPVHASHSFIKGLRGGSSYGTKPGCFDKAAFQSYGLVGGENASMSEQEDVEFATTMEALLKRGVQLPGSTVISMFDNCDPASDNDLDGIISAPSEAIEIGKLIELQKAIQEGKRPSYVDANYTVAVLSPVETRMMTRSFDKGKVTTLLKNVTAWFDDTQVDMKDGLSEPAKLNYFLFTLFVPPDGGSAGKMPSEYVPKQYAVQLFKSAIRGFGIPEVFVQRALIRYWYLVFSKDAPPMTKRSQWAVVFGILKAYLVRKGAQMNESEAFQMGRLFALLDELQRLAIPTIGVSISQKYGRSAVNNPMYMLTVLHERSENYLSKIARERGRKGQDRSGLARNLKALRDEIIVKIGDKWPKALSLEQRAQFVLGGASYRLESARRIEALMAAKRAKAAAEAAAAGKKKVEVDIDEEEIAEEVLVGEPSES